MEVSDIARHLLGTAATTVLIDGRSGAGKTAFAGALQTHWNASMVIHLDDIYPGWDGLRAATEHVHDALLVPRRARRLGRWQRWDWARDAPAEWHVVEPDQPLIIEGSGSLTAQNRALADLGIWIDCPDATRKDRALRRDGAGYATQWDRWARQECDHIARNDPLSIADIVLTE